MTDNRISPEILFFNYWVELISLFESTTKTSLMYSAIVSIHIICYRNNLLGKFEVNSPGCPDKEHETIWYSH